MGRAIDGPASGSPCKRELAELKRSGASAEASAVNASLQGSTRRCIRALCCSRLQSCRSEVHAAASKGVCSTGAEQPQQTGSSQSGSGRERQPLPKLANQLLPSCMAAASRNPTFIGGRAREALRLATDRFRGERTGTPVKGCRTPARARGKASTGSGLRAGVGQALTGVPVRAIAKRTLRPRPPHRAVRCPGVRRDCGASRAHPLSGCRARLIGRRSPIRGSTLVALPRDELIARGTSPPDYRCQRPAASRQPVSMPIGKTVTA